jgi:hypothetical protein
MLPRVEAVASSRGGHDGGQAPGAARADSDSDSELAADSDLGVEECLRCRGCKRRFATASALRRHTSHRHLRNSECAEQKRKNSRLLISTWKTGPAHRIDGIVEDDAAALDGCDLLDSLLQADNADEPADAEHTQVSPSQSESESESVRVTYAAR